MSTSGTGAATNLVGAASFEINKGADTVETTAFGDTNKTYVQGFSDVSGSITVVWDDTYDSSIWTACASTDGVKLYLYPSRNATTIYHYGPAWVSGSLKGDVGSRVEASLSFVANGSWGTKP